MKGKIIIPLLLASLTGGIVATNRDVVNVLAQQNDINSLTNLVGDVVEISDFTASGLVNEEILLPSAVVKNVEGAVVTNNLTFTVKDAHGNNVTVLTYNSGENAGRKYFVATKAGAYNVSYNYGDNESGQLKTTNASPLTIWVTGDEYSITPVTNSKYVIPTTIPSKINGEATVLKIPAPQVLLGDEAVSLNDLEVYVVRRADNVGANTKLTLATSGDHYAWTVLPGNHVYEIQYKYVKGGVTQDFKYETFRVQEDYDVSNLKLSFNKPSSIPTTARVSAPTTLPKISTFNKNQTSDNSLESHTVITVEYSSQLTGIPASWEDVTTQVLNGFTFTPNKVGQYKISYKATLELFGLEDSEVYSFRIENVRDTTAPTVKLVNDYEVDSNGNVSKVTSGTTVLFDASAPENQNLTQEERNEKALVALGDLSHSLPSVVVMENVVKGDNSVVKEAKITLPAIYGFDNLSSYSDLVFERTIRNNTTGSSSTVTIPASANVSTTHTITNINENNTKYTVRYIIRDKNNNTVNVPYELTVVSDVDSLMNDQDEFLLPEITMPTGLPNFIATNQVLSFMPATATDNHDDRVDVKTYYYFDNNVNSKVLLTKTNENSNLVLNLRELTTGQNYNKLTIRAEAYNDYAYEGETRLFAYKETVIDLSDGNETTAPEFLNSNTMLTQLSTLNGVGAIDIDGYLIADGEIPFVEYIGDSASTAIKLPKLRVKDGLNSNLTLSVKVLDANGKALKSALTSESYLDGKDGLETVYAIEGEFKAYTSGVYTVIYTATDAAGNSTIQSFGIRVADVTAPNGIKLDETFFTGKTYAVNQKIVLPNASIIDNNIELSPELGKVTWELAPESPSHSLIYHNDTVAGFIPNQVGAYRIIFHAEDQSGNIRNSIATRTITVENKYAPTLNFESGYESYFTARNYTSGMDVYLPSVEVYDGFRDKTNPANNFDETDANDLVLNIKVTMNTNTIEVKTDSQGKKFFRPTGHGVYNIEYSVTDLEAGAEKTTTKSFTVEIGDISAPTIAWQDGSEVITTATLGESFELDFDKAILNDDKSSVEYLLDNMRITMYDPDNSTNVTNLLEETGGYKWKFEKVGTYRINVLLRDESGKTTTKNYSIVVTEKQAEEKVINSALGTTMIVAASVLFAGLVIYFIVTGRDGRLKKSTKRTTKK